jgi:hypothetical protein
LDTEWRDCSLTFVFPYDPTKLLDVLGHRSDEVRELASRATDAAAALGNAPDDARRGSDFVRLLTQLVQAVDGGFSHFARAARIASDMVRKNRGVSELELARRIGRIVVAKSAPSVRANSLWLLYPMLLGWHVPHYFATEDEWSIEHRLTSEDYLLVEEMARPAAPSIFGDERWLRALRYYSAANLLIVTGWPCALTTDLAGAPTHAPGRLQRLWREAISAGDPPPFSGFPVIEMWKQCFRLSGGTLSPFGSPGQRTYDDALLMEECVEASPPVANGPS